VSTIAASATAKSRRRMVKNGRPIVKISKNGSPIRKKQAIHPFTHRSFPFVNPYFLLRFFSFSLFFLTCAQAFFSFASALGMWASRQSRKHLVRASAGESFSVGSVVWLVVRERESESERQNLFEQAL
jgi:hypothetical protein